MESSASQLMQMHGQDSPDKDCAATQGGEMLPGKRTVQKLGVDS